MELQRFSKTWREKQKTAKQFIQDESFANAVLETLVASESVNLRNLKEQTITKMEKNLRERFPSVQRINSMINKRKPMICLVCYATLNDGYYLFGCSGWIKVRGKWRTYYPSGVYQSKKDSPKEGLQVRYCGCCGDVNTWYCKDGDEVSEYFYVY